MLRQLRIQHIILIDHADIHFEEGLNVLSGETGSGKSAIMEALSLVLGERADTGLIRRGCDKGVVEALFEVERIPGITSILEKAGIEHEPHDGLVIRREIHSNGKSRAYVNNQMAQLTLLRALGDSLIDIVGQHANQRLRTLEKHREIVDLYGDLEPLVEAFQSAWQHETALRCELETLVNSESQRLRDIEVCQMELEELNEANLKEGEEEELFVEYTLLTHAEELIQKTGEITHLLSDDRHAVIIQLNRLKTTIDQLVRIDESFSEAAKVLQSSLIELQEISQTARAYQGRLEYNPIRIEEVNQRLALLTRLKRKYGNTVAEIQLYKTQIEQRLDLLQNADVKIENLKEQLIEAEKCSNDAASKLTKERKSISTKFEKAIVAQLRVLNMPKVEFHVKIETHKRNSTGDDRIEFFLAPNVGEHLIPIRESASGGELSRLMLALQTVLAGKEKIPTLVFDEIDANIGGETAAIIGDKLSEIGKQHQVLCITHFPQVAKRAQHHLQISKMETDGRTVTHIKVLDIADRENEIARMLGKSSQ